MRIRRLLAMLVAAPLAVAAFPGAAQADPDPDLHITSVTLSQSAVAVSGLNTASVAVTVKGSYDSGVPSDANIPVNVILERTGGVGQEGTLLSTNLVRNQAAGTWTGPLQVPSTANGTFKVTGVITGPFFPGSGSMTTPTPYAGPALAITGTHQPKITASVIPKLVPYNTPYSIKWAIVDAQTGRPYGSRLRVVLGIDNTCAEYFGPGYTNLTGVDGSVTKAYAAADSNAVNCLLLPGNPASVGGLGLVVARPVTKPTISVVPSRTSAPVGTIVPVNGSVHTVRQGCMVYLQRLYGASQWRNLNSAALRTSLRYTVNAQPAYKGNIPYRIVVPACSSITAISKVFYIRGT